MSDPIIKKAYDLAQKATTKVAFYFRKSHHPCFESFGKLYNWLS